MEIVSKYTEQLLESFYKEEQVILPILWKVHKKQTQNKSETEDAKYWKLTCHKCLVEVPTGHDQVPNAAKFSVFCLQNIILLWYLSFTPCLPNCLSYLSI